MINEDFSKRSKIRDVGRWYVTMFVKETASKLSAGSSVLDAGAGESVYKNLFSHCEYKAIDLAVGESKWNYANLDYVGPLHEMPVEDGIFDAVLCTQVLEHLEWPRESVREMHRVLRPGGVLYMTVPMAHAEHQIPYDFFRYTSYGLRSICAHAGFDEIEVKPFGGLWARWAYELPRSLSLFPSVRNNDGKVQFLGFALFPIKGLSFIFVRLIQTLFLWLDQFDKKRNFPFGWWCIAKKSI